MIRSSELLQVIATRHADVRPTALESFLQCPFQFFGTPHAQTRRAAAPADQRLDFRMRAKSCIRRLRVGQHEIADRSLFDRIFDEAVQEKNFPRDTRPNCCARKCWRICCTSPKMTAGPRISRVKPRKRLLALSWTGSRFTDASTGYLKTPDGRGFIVDYKYSKQTENKLENQSLLQGPLYALALERAFGLRPGGMVYCAVRDGFQYGGWGEQLDDMNASSVLPLTPEWVAGRCGAQRARGWGNSQRSDRAVSG